MRIGFWWGILSGCAVLVAAGWVVLALTGEPQSPPLGDAAPDSPTADSPDAGIAPADPAMNGRAARQEAGADESRSDVPRAEGTAPPAPGDDAAMEPGPDHMPPGIEGAPGGPAPGDETKATSGAASGTASGTAPGHEGTVGPGSDTGTDLRESTVGEAPRANAAAAVPSRAENRAGISATGSMSRPDAPVTQDSAAGAGPETGAPAGQAAPADHTLPDLAPAPRFDIVRVDANGQAVIAGKARPGQQIDIMLDDEMIARITADRSGSFVAIVTIEQAGKAQRLRLRTPLPETPGDRVTKAATTTRPVALPGHGPARTGNSNVTQGEIATDTMTASPTRLPGEAGNEDRAAPTAGSPAPGEMPAGTRPMAARSVTTTGNAPGTPDRTTVVSAPGGDASPDAIDGRAATNARYAFSKPVLILPSQKAGGTPALVRAGDGELALLQPADQPGRATQGVILDQISYGQSGDVRMLGRADKGRVVRIYGDGQLIATAPVENGAWRITLPRGRVEALSLLRLDEIGPAGKVTSRIEVPFSYEQGKPQTLRRREVIIQRGDNLWRIAEQFYGDGLRYSLIYGANSELIRDPDLIYPGQVFSIPELVGRN